MLTRRRVTTGVIVVATGGLATVAMAAGPVVYSEYTTGGDRESRVVQEDGTGDVGLPIDTTGATVSPDGRRIAQTAFQAGAGRRDDRYASELRVTAGDGSSPVTVLRESRPRAGADETAVVTGRPVWSPDSQQVLVQRSLVGDGDAVRTTRVICVVDTKACRDAGEVALDEDGGTAGLRGDVVAWQAADGPIVRDAARGGVLRRTVRCGSGPRTVKGPTVRLRGLPGSSFGPPLALRGLVGPSHGEGDAVVDPTTIGALATSDGTLVVDAPQADARRGTPRCRGRDAQIDLRTSLGLSRVRLRAGGRTRTLPTPPGLRRGTALRLVGTAGGGAVLIGTGTPGRRSFGICFAERPRGRGRARSCAYDLSSGGADDAEGRGVLRIWRYVPGPAPRFDRVTTARRSALRTLADATDFTVAAGDAVLAVTDDAIERVPLDGGAPTTIARGRGLSLDVSSW